VLQVDLLDLGGHEHILLPELLRVDRLDALVLVEREGVAPAHHGLKLLDAPGHGGGEEEHLAVPRGHRAEDDGQVVLKRGVQDPVRLVEHQEARVPERLVDVGVDAHELGQAPGRGNDDVGPLHEVHGLLPLVEAPDDDERIEGHPGAQGVELVADLERQLPRGRQH